MAEPAGVLHRFVHELRRRRVFRVVGVYAVAAWLVVEVAATVLPVLEMPDWTTKLVVVLAILGFPVAFALAWAFDITPQGLTRTEAPGSVQRAEAVSQLTGGQVGRIAVAAAVLILAVGGAGWWLTGGKGSPLAEGRMPLNSIAVLPFVNMSEDRDNEYFSDGITEELLDDLAKLPGLKVAARTSSFAFKGQDLPVPEIASQLGVASVLEGSVRKAGTRVRITAQLIEGETGFHLWSDTYDRELTDVFAIQDQIARTIVDTLRLTLAEGDEPVAAAAATVNVEAHDLYLLARHRFHQRGAESLAEAERLFRAAAEADPDYAEAYAGLAMAHGVLPLFDPDRWPVERSIAQGRAAAEKALALDPTLADAHAALGQIAQNFEWDFDAAERHYIRAVELNPNDAQVRMWRAEVMVVTGREGAAEEVERALALDPLSPIANSITALVHLLMTRDYARSAEVWRRTEELDPTFSLLLELSPLTFVALEEWEEVRARLLRLAKTPADSQLFTSWTHTAAAVRAGTAAPPAGVPAAATRFGEITSLGDAGTILLTGPIDSSAALDILERIAGQPRYRQPMTWLGRFWFFDPVRDDPRFQAIFERVGLPVGN